MLPAFELCCHQKIMKWIGRIRKDESTNSCELDEAFPSVILSYAVCSSYFMILIIFL